MTDLLPSGATTAATPTPTAAAAGFTDLRHQAERRMQKLAPPADRAAPSGPDALRLLHELQVHQIELELQADELKNARDAAEEAAARYTDLYDFAPVGYLTLNRAGAITQLNLACAQLLGSARAQLAGKHLGLWLAGAAVPTFNAFLRQAFEAGAQPACELGLHVGGQTITVQIDASVSDDRQACRLVLVDISARKLAEQASMQAHAALAQANAELARSNADLEQFAYAASHDLIEPLRSVASSVQLLQKRYGGQLDARADEFIAHAVSGATRMKTLIDDLLAFSRVASQQRQDDDIAMDYAVSEAIKNLGTAIAESNAKITHDPLPHVQGHGTQITQLLQNLLANAIKFRGTKAAVVHVGARQAGTHWVFSVADQGIGIDAKHLERVFELFKRLHTREEYAGTGIGLALCKKIVERHGGRVWVESTPGQGACFYFTLPVQMLSNT